MIRVKRLSSLSPVFGAERIVIKHNGKAYLVELSKANEIPLVDLDAGSKPIPDQPKPDPKLQPLASKVKAASDSVQDATTLKAIAAVYGATAQALEQGKVKYSDAGGKLDKLVAALAKARKVKLTAWRTEIATLLNAEHAAGRTKDAATLAAAYRAIETGINESLAGRGLLDKIDLGVIIEIVVEVLSNDGEVDWLKLILKLLAGV